MLFQGRAVGAGHGGGDGAQEDEAERPRAAASVHVAAHHQDVQSAVLPAHPQGHHPAARRHQVGRQESQDRSVVSRQCLNINCIRHIYSSVLIVRNVMCIAEQEYCSLTEALGMDVMEVIERGSTSTGIATAITVVL